MDLHGVEQQQQQSPRHVEAISDDDGVDVAQFRHCPPTDAPILHRRRLLAHVGPRGRLPQRQTDLSAGLDIYAAQDVSLPRGHVTVVGTDLRIRLPPATYGRICGRSGLAARHGVTCIDGVVDADYEGEIGVMLLYHGPPATTHVLGGDASTTSATSATLAPTALTSSSRDMDYGASYFRVKRGDRIAQLIVQPYAANLTVERVTAEFTITNELPGLGHTESTKDDGGDDDYNNQHLQQRPLTAPRRCARGQHGFGSTGL